MLFVVVGDKGEETEYYKSLGKTRAGLALLPHANPYKGMIFPHYIYTRSMKRNNATITLTTKIF